MNRTMSWCVLAVVAGASCVWWTGLRADEAAAVTSPANQVEELLARIEKLERRVQSLEVRQQALHEVDAVFEPAGGWLVAPPNESNPGTTSGSATAPRPSERPAGGVFLPRHIVTKPETPEEKPLTREGPSALPFGGVRITR